MKTSKIILSLLLTGACCVAQAQVVVQENARSTKKQFQIGQILTKQMATQLFGTPERFSTQYDDEVFDAVFNRYQYSDFGFSTVNDEVLDFGIESDKYIVIIKGKYMVQVGDNLETFKKSIPEGEVFIKAYNGMIAFHFKLDGLKTYSDNSLVITTDANGKIDTIAWNVPI